MPPVRIRPPTASELPLLQGIERAAGVAFGAVGLAAVAGDAPPTAERLDAFRLAGLAWVAEAPGGRPIAYLVACVIDGAFHVGQVSVHPSHARQGIGARLIDHLAGHARRSGAARVTLTTFRDVAWNAPYYGRIGFRVLPAADQGPELCALVAAEAQALSVDAPRVAMARRV